MKQVQDFVDESAALGALIAPLAEADLRLPTSFKGWTIEMVIRHLHTWNVAARISLTEGSLETFLAFAREHMGGGAAMTDFEAAYWDGLSGHELVDAWRAGVAETAQAYSGVDPAQRIKWVGPDMSARSAVTARLMETWAHGQEIYDELGVVRQNTDRIQNIAVLGIKTYNWSFAVRGETAPQPAPFVKLVGPSGAVWTYGEPSESEFVEGSAEEFCQVVTQVRNVADTSLSVVGPNAAAWMANAQCFAGAAETPPAPGTRKTASKRRAP